MQGEAPLRQQEYDYIVVGSGAGGGPVAANLARAGFTVALLDAGGADISCDYSVPAFFSKVSEDPELRWDYVVKHFDNDAEQARDPKRVPDGDGFGIWYPRSGTLGGCTAHNALITICPYPSDWERIAEATGDRSWSAALMSEYFTRLERCYYCKEPNFGRPHPGGHGFTGWLATNIARPKLLVADWKVLRIVVTALLFELKGKFWSTLCTVWRAWWNFKGGPIEFVTSLFDPNDRRTPCCEREGLFFVPFATESARRVSVRDLLTVTQQDQPREIGYPHQHAGDAHPVRTARRTDKPRPRRERSRRSASNSWKGCISTGPTRVRCTPNRRGRASCWRAAKSFSPPAPSTRRRCSCFPASVRARNWRSTASMCCSTARGSGAICRTATKFRSSAAPRPTSPSPKARRSAGRMSANTPIPCSRDGSRAAGPMPPTACSSHSP